MTCLCSWFLLDAVFGHSGQFSSGPLLDGLPFEVVSPCIRWKKNFGGSNVLKFLTNISDFLALLGVTGDFFLG